MCASRSRFEAESVPPAAVWVAAAFAAGDAAPPAIGELRQAGLSAGVIGLLVRTPAPAGDAFPGGLCETNDFGELPLAAGRISELGIVIAIGILVGALATAAANPRGEGMEAALAALGIPRRMAQSLFAALQAGDVVLAVQADRFASEAQRIIACHGGRTITD